jgi:hypothetical protein
MITRVAKPRAHQHARAGRRLVSTSVLALLFVVTACGGDGSGDDAGGAVAQRDGQQAGTASDPAATGDSADRLQVTISERPFPGMHEVTGDMACFAQPGIWGAGISRLGDPGISEFLLMLQGVPVTGGSTEQVEFSVTFGDVMTDPTGESSGLVGIGGAVGGGTGSATVTPEGRGATIEVEGTSNHGTAIRAVVRCANVEVVR